MVIAVGDIHGCADELRTLLDQLPLTPETTVLFLGDYVDRGPKSRLVLEIIMKLAERCRVVPLLGNHEAMFLEFLRDPYSPTAAGYIFNGGSSTLASYSDDYGDYVIPESHYDFLSSLDIYHEDEHHLFVHAGLPNVPIQELDVTLHRRDMLWIRDSFLCSDFSWSKVIVHGHTPVDAVTILRNRINLDTGCVFNGRLSAIELPEGRVYSVPRQLQPRVLLRDRRSRRAAVRFRGTTPVKVFRGEETCLFETVDYSEIGLFIRSLDESAGVMFDVDELLHGLIGADERSLVEFTGQVVRCVVDERGLCYGVRLLSVRER